jgi:hypothetical protein
MHISIKNITYAFFSILSKKEENINTYKNKNIKKKICHLSLRRLSIHNFAKGFLVTQHKNKENTNFCREPCGFNFSNFSSNNLNITEKV